MKARTIISTGLALGLFGLATPRNVQADYPPFTENNPQSNHETPPRQPPENAGAAGGSLSGQGTGASLQPQPANCASKLIGLKVTNQSNEQLGTVKDVVFNLQTGHIAYVVVEKASPAGGSGEFTAVRPTSLTASSDEKSLTLNVDKDVFEQSRGFSSTNYPQIVL